jgi:uncharacterized membrane protein YfcA
VIGESVALVSAGLLAGVVGAGGGTTSLVSYPALLAVGVPPLPATVANLVAAVACGPGSALTSRREFATIHQSFTRMLPTAVCGAACGSLLLANTPPGVFSRVVPFLILLGSLALLLQPWLTARVPARDERARSVGVPLVGVVSIYSGYFGSGSGVLLLALLLVLIDDRLPEANAIKNVVLGASALASATVFVVTGPVDWTAAVPLGAGLAVGSAAGPVLARNVPPAALRWSSRSWGSPSRSDSGGRRRDLDEQVVGRGRTSRRGSWPAVSQARDLPECRAPPDG